MTCDNIVIQYYASQINQQYRGQWTWTVLQELLRWGSSKKNNSINMINL